MRRLERENFNTREYYNKVLNEHFDEKGLDFTDIERIKLLLKKYQGGKLLDKGGIIALSTPYREKRKNHQYKQHIWSISKRDIHNLLGKCEIIIWSNNLICYGTKN